MQSPDGSPNLSQLTPYYDFQSNEQRYIPLSRFYGSQKLNLMHSTRLPANSRKYSPGDPVHLIDWRVFARNEQLIIREQAHEASCRTLIAIDDSLSMNWPEQGIAEELDAHVPTKREIALRLGLHLIYQSLKNGDSATLCLLSQGRFRVLSLKSQVDVEIAFKSLQENSFKVQFDRFIEVDPDKWLGTHRFDLVFWLSDGFKGFPKWIQENVATYKVWMHILSSLEVKAEWMKRSSCYFDKTHQVQEFTGASLIEGDNFTQAVRSWQEKIQQNWALFGQSYFPITDRMSIGSYLTKLRSVQEKNFG